MQGVLLAPSTGRFDALANPIGSALERRIRDGSYAADAQALALAFLDYLEQRTAD